MMGEAGNADTTGGQFISPAEHDELLYEKSFVESILRGFADIESGNLYSKADVSEELKKRRASRKGHFRRRRVD